MLLTVIIPCYNSAKTIVYVVEEIKKEILKRPKNKYQIILVNDDSKDNTFQVISDLAKADPGIVAIDLARNFGQANAKMAAVHISKGIRRFVWMTTDSIRPTRFTQWLIK